MTNRGKDLESKINKVNIKYRKSEDALIYKLDLPIAITKAGPIIKRSTVDYIGSLGSEGYAVAFDAKETQNKTSFPLKNIHDHQLEFLELWNKTGGIAALLIWFKKVDKDEAFWTPVKFVLDFINEGKRKSIPYDDFEDDWKVPLTDYLEIYD